MASELRDKAPTVVILKGEIGSGKDATGTVLCEEHGFVRVAFADALREYATHEWNAYADAYEGLLRRTLSDPFLGLRDVTVHVPRLTLEALEDRDRKERPLTASVAFSSDAQAHATEVPLTWGDGAPVSMRSVLQRTGTEGLRGHLGKDVLVRTALGRVKDALARGANVVMTDGRFAEELVDAKAELRKLGVRCETWEVRAPDAAPVPPAEGGAAPHQHESETAGRGIACDRSFINDKAQGFASLRGHVARLLGELAAAH